MLIILDGWGNSPIQEGNAVYLAGTPYLNYLVENYPSTILKCSGEAVGLPEGVMGNSEVGHLNIGAGRIVYQDLLRIDIAIREGHFFENEVLKKIMADVIHHQSTLHLIGLVSDGGVHSQLTHLFALLDMAKAKGVPSIKVHAILDGRDTPPDSGVKYIEQLQNHINTLQAGAIASICGRFYAMDRDKRWERVEKAYRLYTVGEGILETDPIQAVKNAYDRNETDEFVKPIVIVDSEKKPIGVMNHNDGVIFFNFRADRAREITKALTDPAFGNFPRDKFPKFCEFVCMTMYDETFTLPVAFPPEHLDGIFGEVISQHGLKQLRIAETEKYAHVTYFFNGGEEKPFPLEDRCLIPSPRDVQTYDQKPEMSAPEVTREVLARLESNEYDVIILNFANMDMVGHTGVLSAAIRACEVVDACVGQIVSQVLDMNGVVAVTADHGNAETMIDENGHVHTAHTTNPVNFILVDESRKHLKLRQEGKLGDIAPTLLEILNIKQPHQMTGKSLLIN